MHIEFGVGLQKLGSLSRRKFYPEEIDNLLNRAQEQFVRDSIRVEEDDHGFQQTQIDVDRIRNLITKIQIPAEFIEATTEYKEYKLHLPANYAHWVSYNAYQAKDCDAVSTSTISRYYFRLPVKTSTKESPKYYIIANIKLGSDSVVDLDTDTRQGTGIAIYTGFASKEDKFEVVNLLKEIVSLKLSNGLAPIAGHTIHGLYYERYGSLYFPGELILVTSPSTTAPSAADSTITLDATEATAIADTTTSIPYSRHASTDTYSITSGSQLRASSIDAALTTPFYQPQVDNPILTIDHNQASLFSHKNRIVNRVGLTYVRQPQRISLSLQRNSEIAEDFHRKIVDLAVDYAAGHIEAERLKAVTELEKRNN